MADLMFNRNGDALAVEFIGPGRLRVTARPGDGGEGRSREYVAADSVAGLVAACRAMLGRAEAFARLDTCGGHYSGIDAAVDAEMLRAALAAAGEG